MPNRREMLATAIGLAAAPLSALDAEPATAPGPFPYDYLFVEVPRGAVRTTALAGLIAHLKSAGGAAVAAAGGEIVGYFTPLIGWSSEQLTIMIRWSDTSPGRERVVADLTRHPSIRRCDRSSLAPTARPAPGDHPKTAGIYTHRWFEIRTADVAEFVELSARAWPDFEKEFDAAIFGLFRARAQAGEMTAGVTRMLLNTQYASHAVWEASRTPSANTADLFRRRSDMTLTTHVASVHFTPIAAG